MEQEKLKDAIVGLLSVTRMSTEEIKRFTIVVYLVAITFIIFMVELTSSLDGREVAILM